MVAAATPPPNRAIGAQQGLVSGLAAGPRENAAVRPVRGGENVAHRTQLSAASDRAPSHQFVLVHPREGDGFGCGLALHCGSTHVGGTLPRISVGLSRREAADDGFQVSIGIDLLRLLDRK